MGKRKELMSCRDILWYMVFFGFAINYLLRINLNIAIISMVVPRPKAVAAVQCTQRIHSSNSSLPSQQLSTDRYPWSEYEQGLVLGAYFWFHWLTQLPGGLLARRYGTKTVFGCGNLFTGLLGFLIPLATRHNLYALVFLRALQGLIAGTVWPSMHNMTAKWIPPNERSKFVSSYLGSSVGAAITFPLCAILTSLYGWDAVFYITSLISIIWFFFWAMLVYDSPHEHPRISAEEFQILQDLKVSTDTKNAVPWTSILTSGPVWVNCISHWGGIWGLLTIMTQAPSYFNYVHGWNVNATGILSGLPHLLRMLFSYVFSSFSDWLLRTRRMNRTNVRKLATFVCTGMQGFATLALGFSGCEPYLAIFFMMAGTAVSGSVSAGTLSVFVDLSPNYASVLLGFSGLLVGAAGYLSPLIVGYLTNGNQTIEQWRLVFIISALNLGVSCIVFTFCGTVEEQTWNLYGVNEKTVKKEEMQALKPGQEKEKSGKEGVVG